MLLTMNNASTAALDNQAPCWPAGGRSAADEGWACPAYLLPDATVDFHALLGAGAGASLRYTLQVNDLPVTRYHRPNNFSRLGIRGLPRWAAGLTLVVEPAKLGLMDSLTRA